MYQQLVCPNAYFGNHDRGAVVVENVKVSKKEEEISFVHKMEKEVSYVGVVGHLETGEQIFYRPVQLATLWGKWN